ncbi:TPA: hypothetical protein ACK11E_003499 [Citrobacter pasteurii]|nr:hypothetical protein [Citrobacter sp. Cu233]MDM2934922.1 hypothetical protein [Citrobacter sp. Cu233]
MAFLLNAVGRIRRLRRHPAINNPTAPTKIGTPLRQHGVNPFAFFLF